MPDNVKLLLWDATYHGFYTDCLLMSIDWRFLYQNFIKIGQVVLFYMYLSKKTFSLPLPVFDGKMEEQCFCPILSFCNFLSQRHKISPKWKMIMKLHQISFHTIPLTYFQLILFKKERNLKMLSFTIFIENSAIERKFVFTPKTCKI